MADTKDMIKELMSQLDGPLTENDRQQIALTSVVLGTKALLDKADQIIEQNNEIQKALGQKTENHEAWKAGFKEGRKDAA